MRKPPSPTAQNWSRAHAGLMLGGLLFAGSDAPLYASALLAALSFAVLTWIFRGRWTPSGSFGLANTITAFRFGMVGLLAALSAHPYISAGLAVIVLILDGIDGWQARRSNSISLYGEVADMEVDAFFTLMLCLILFRSDRFGWWILIAGTLRYLFVLTVSSGSLTANHTVATRWSRAAGAIGLAGLIICLMPFGTAASWLGATVTGMVMLSFAYSFRRVTLR